jgi:hypothetical protein
VIEARRKHPDAPQIEIAQQAVVSRSNVWRIAWVQSVAASHARAIDRQNGSAGWATDAAASQAMRTRGRCLDIRAGNGCPWRFR